MPGDFFNDDTLDDPEFMLGFASPFGNPVDLRFGADFEAPKFESFTARIYHYETFHDPLGHEYIIRTDLETGERVRFVLPPPTARD